MHIWVDADACPGVIKEILYRVAERTRLPLTLVANQWLKTPPYPSIRSIQVARGFDVADNHIVDQVEAGDLVITADIPLAAAVIDKGALALNPRGELYSKENIRQMLDMRNFMDTLRSSGVEHRRATGFQPGRPPGFRQPDRPPAGQAPVAQGPASGAASRRALPRGYSRVIIHVSCVAASRRPPVRRFFAR